MQCVSFIQGVIIGPSWSMSRCLFWNIYFRKKAKTERKPWCRQSPRIILLIVAAGKNISITFPEVKGDMDFFFEASGGNLLGIFFFFSANGQLVVWGLVVWIPGILWWKLRFANFPIKPPNLASHMRISAGSFGGHKQNSAMKVGENLCCLLFRW